MPNPITPEMRAALAEVVDSAEHPLTAGESVMDLLPQLRALLDALPTVQESRIVEATAEESSADHCEDTRAMVGVDEQAEFEAWAGPRGLPMLIADPVPPDYDSFGNYLYPRSQAAWRAWQERSRRATASAAR